MRRLAVGLAGLFVLGLLAASGGVDAQSSGKVARVGFLGGGSPATPSGRQGFLDALGRLGYVEGQNIVFEARFAEGHADRLPAFARELVGLNVDLILTSGTPATRAAKAATATIPIVFTLAADPVRSGLVQSFARPGGNLTGFAYGAYEDKRLEVLKEVMPGLSRVACLCPPAEEPFIASAIRALRLQMQFLDPRGPEDLDRAFAAARSGRAEAILVPDIAWITDSIVQRIADLATKSRLPAISHGRSFATHGGLASYGPAESQARPRVLAYMDRILKGAKPGDLPVEQPTRFELVINARTAKALGLTIPQTLLLRADELIQ